MLASAGAGGALAMAGSGTLGGTGGTSTGGGASGGSEVVAGAGGVLVDESCPGDAADAYQGTPGAIPGVIEAENFDDGGYSDSTSGNEGGAYRTDVDVDINELESGYDIGWMTAGEWLEYTVNVAEEGDYRIVVRAGAVDRGRTLEISKCDTLLAHVAIPRIAAWGEMATTSSGPVHLRAGLQVIRVTMGSSDYLDFDSLDFEPVDPEMPMLGATPPMGWNSWNTFQCNISESLIKGIADVMVSSGMRDVGYEYVNLDDCWMDGRDEDGKLRWNTDKFPSGISALADYVHDKGLKLGIYEVPADRTCLGRYGGVDPAIAVGSLGHESIDAETFASWGVDYLKYDLCLGDRDGFAVMRDALQAAGRPIFYSINPGNGEGDLCPPSTCSLDLLQTATMWRIGFDINTSWSSVLRLLDQNSELYPYAGPGHWNDPDMLEVGNGMTDTEGRAHFSLWAIMAAPLIAGNDLRSMSATTQGTLTNAEVIAVDQDPLGIQGRVVATPGQDLQVWSKTLAGQNARAVVLFNRGASSAPIMVQWSDLGLPAGSASVRDLWSHTDLGTFDDSYTAASVPSHGVVMLEITSVP